MAQLVQLEQTRKYNYKYSEFDYYSNNITCEIANSKTIMKANSFILNIEAFLRIKIFRELTYFRVLVFFLYNSKYSNKNTTILTVFFYDVNKNHLNFEKQKYKNIYSLTLATFRIGTNTDINEFS